MVVRETASPRTGGERRGEWRAHKRLKIKDDCREPGPRLRAPREGRRGEGGGTGVTKERERFERKKKNTVKGVGPLSLSAVSQVILSFSRLDAFLLLLFE
jgi:hypothetical protein